MVDIYNINKFLKSCGGRWSIEACPINAFLSFLFVVKEFSFTPLLFFFTPVVIKLTLYMWFLDRIAGCFEEAGRVRRGRRRLSVLGRWMEAELSFCPRRWAHAEGCSNSSDRRALETRSSVFWSLTGNDCTCTVRQRAESERSVYKLDKNLTIFWSEWHHQSFQKAWFTFGRRAARNSCSGDVARWGRSEPCSQSSCPPPHPSPSGRPLNDPVGRWRTSWRLDHVRHPRGSYCGPYNENEQGGKCRRTKEEFALSFGRWFFLLGDGERCDLSWVSVVLAIKRSVHGEFAPEDQLSLPSVPCGHPEIHAQTRSIKKTGPPSISRWVFFYVVSSVEPVSILVTELRSQSEFLL